ncbi:hypothetical protein PG989_006787 [Apiospora arundinis]
MGRSDLQRLEQKVPPTHAKGHKKKTKDALRSDAMQRYLSSPPKADPWNALQLLEIPSPPEKPEIKPSKHMDKSD